MLVEEGFICKDILKKSLIRSIYNGDFDAIKNCGNKTSKAIKYIFDNYKNCDLSGRHNIAKHCHSSESNLSHHVKSELGFTLSDITLCLRIMHAGFLLSETNYPICKILFLCGYNDQSNFGRSFKKCTGYTPRAFRKLSVNDIVF
ncbi:helix-turn-helix domain-containing protein [Vibrio sonorensis]|uniref:helix-turn-helix domain-containing protein n=1 Tax=Vibrio sonorensis TaxID=1004316 RepID=UPI00111427E0|nr:helix-turn-helix transcriptional regulator [Vibrio sonorensis]